ncbi:MAG: tripartite tricarboxylate transporter substrate binding protein [Rhodocyclaceae bacterium]
MNLRRLFAASLLVLSPLAAVHGAPVAGAYPDKPVTLVVPYAKGSNGDNFGRSMARHIPPVLDSVSFVIENKAGDSGIPATVDLLKAAPDGYTLGLGRAGNLVIGPAMNPATPYTVSSFTLLGVLEFDPLICAVPAGSPHRSARDLFAAMRKAPGKLRYGSTGLASPQYFAARYLLRLGGLPANAATNQNFESSTESTVALKEGRVDLVCGNAGNLIAAIKAGGVRGLFSTAPGRLPELPELPNAQEVGLRDMSKLMGWTALIGPPGMPPKVVARWRHAITRLADNPDWRAETMQYGGVPTVGTLKDNEGFIREQATLYKRLAPLLKAQP